MENPANPSTTTSAIDDSAELHGTVAVVHVVGDVDLASAPALTAEIDAVLAKTPEKLVIDLSKATMLDSSGLGVLITTMKRLETDGNSTVLELVVTEPNIMKVFSVTGLDNVFTFATEGAPS